MQVVVSSQILILQLLLHFCFSSLHMSQFRACDFFILCLCSNTSKKDTSALLYDTKGQRIMMVVGIMSTTTLQHFSNVANSPKHPCTIVDVVSSYHSSGVATPGLTMDLAQATCISSPCRQTRF